ncbi:S1 family peptidase [Campylobacterota bacterium DY0563]
MSSEFKRESIFIIESKKNGLENKRGTCFAISSTLVLTANHVVTEGDDFCCFTSDEYSRREERKLECLISNSEFDYAILKAVGFSFDDFIELGKVSTNNIKVKICGYPIEKENLPAEIKTETNTNFDDIESTPYCFEVIQQSEVSDYSGMSGSPIMYNDYVIGILLYQEVDSVLYGITNAKVENDCIDNGLFLNNIEYIKDLEFIEVFENAIKDIQDEINSMPASVNKINLISSINDVQKYFKTKLLILHKILLQVQCVKSAIKHRFDAFDSLYKLLVYFTIFKNASASFTFPTESNLHIYVDSYNGWLFNVSRNERDLDFHIGKIAEYIAGSESNYKDKDATFFISSLKNHGGLDCNTCTSGLLVNVDRKVNKIVTDFTDASSKDILNAIPDYMQLRPEQKVDFKCGQCVSNIHEYENAKKII